MGAREETIEAERRREGGREEIDVSCLANRGDGVTPCPAASTVQERQGGREGGYDMFQIDTESVPAI